MGGSRPITTHYCCFTVCHGETCKVTTKQKNKETALDTVYALFGQPYGVTDCNACHTFVNCLLSLQKKTKLQDSASATWGKEISKKSKRLSLQQKSEKRKQKKIEKSIHSIVLPPLDPNLTCLTSGGSFFIIHTRQQSSSPRRKRSHTHGRYQKRTTSFNRQVPAIDANRAPSAANVVWSDLATAAASRGPYPALAERDHIAPSTLVPSKCPSSPTVNR